MKCHCIFNMNQVITDEGGEVHLGKVEEGPIVKI